MRIEKLSYKLTAKIKINQNDGSKCRHNLHCVCKQVADAMAYVEKMNCIHRDIAARNVFMKDDRTVKLGDFGLSRSLSSSYYQASNGKEKQT